MGSRKGAVDIVAPQQDEVLIGGASGNTKVQLWTILQLERTNRVGCGIEHPQTGLELR